MVCKTMTVKMNMQTSLLNQSKYTFRYTKYVSKRIKFTNKNKLINVKRKTKMASSEVAKNLHPKKKLAQTHGPPISHGTL